MSNKTSQELTATEIEATIICLETMSNIMLDQKWPKSSTLNTYRQIIAKLKAMKEAK